MTEEFVRTSLFRPFATTKESGLGVGLSQCRSIAEAHGGTIQVESVPNRGSSFRVRLPIQDAVLFPRTPSPPVGERPIEREVIR